MNRLLFLLMLLTASVRGDSIVPTEEMIRREIDIVVYGTLVSSPAQEASIKMIANGQTSEWIFMQVTIHPWQYFPDLSVRFRRQVNYTAYVNKEYWPDENDFDSKPRLWGLKQQEIFEFVAYWLRPNEADTRLVELENQMIQKFNDPTVMRPLSLDTVENELSSQVHRKGDSLLLVVKNDSDFSVYYKMISGKRLSTGKDSFTFYVEGERDDGTWRGLCGLAGSSEEINQFAIPIEIEPRSELSFTISVWKGRETHDTFRVRSALYPSPEMMNGHYFHSKPFSLEP